MKFILYTDKGNRKNNEDSILLISKESRWKISNDDSAKVTGDISIPCGAIISDGMGGYEAGEVASSITCEEFSNSFFDFFNEQDIPASDKTYTSRCKEILQKTFNRINFRINSLSTLDSKYKDTGATIAGVCLLNDGNIIAFHAGDSRVYLLKGEYLQLLTLDHNLRSILLKNGEDIPEGKGKELINCVGGGLDSNYLEIKILENNMIKNGDSIFICSDGVYDCVDIDFLESTLQIENPENLVDKIKEEISKNGAFDNNSFIVLKID
ncbi:MAG: serine/threonine-protein phosphatase [Caldisericia bacterium]|nr:serine/threonine-protein phosphatase [Caldisericia bacterium]